MQLARLTNRRRTRAAAILLAMWALFLLSAMVISWALDIDARLSLSSGANRALEAEAMACSGAEVALALPTTVLAASKLRLAQRLIFFTRDASSGSVSQGGMTRVGNTTPPKKKKILK